MSQKHLRLLALLAAAPFAALAQTGGVAIGATAPDISAALDIVSSTKGALLPRVADATALATPATGLLVFQTNAPAGFYYNAGTPAAPNWQRLATGSGGAAGDNLGNHTATQDLNLQGNALVGTGSSVGSAVGVGVRADGGLNLGENNGDNVFLGYQAGDVSNSFSNVFVGSQAGLVNTGGFNNVYLGTRSGVASTGGFSNVFSGYQSGRGNTTGSYNVFSGSSSGRNNTTGSNNTALGFGSGPATGSGAITNATALGASVALTTSNTVVLGNGASVGIGTPAPSQKLEVAGQVFSSTGGFRFPDNTLQTTAATTPTASNGLTKTGNDIALGGALTQATTIAQAGNAFSLTGTGNVGIGTPTPGQKLEVAGQVFSSTGGFRFPDNTLQTTAATTPTASNGLTKTGNDIALGGALTQNTTVLQNGSSLALGGGAAVAQQLSQPLSNTAYSTSPTSLGLGQSFLLPAGVTVTQVDVYGDGQGSRGTFRLSQGAPGGPVLGSQSVVYSGGPGLVSVVLATPVTVGAAGLYSFSTGSDGTFLASNANPYSGGTVFGGSRPDGTYDLRFVVYYSGPVAPTLYASSTGQVGIGSGAPTQALEVAGQVFSNAGGFRFPDNTVQTTAATTATGTNFIQNQTTAAQAGGFRVSGDGLVGGNVGIGTPTPGQRLEVAGQVFSNTGGFRFPDNTVQTTAVVAATGTSFIQNQTTQQASSNFSISGNGYVGGNVGIGTNYAATRLDVNGVTLIYGNTLPPSFCYGTSIGWNALYSGRNESEFYNYRVTGAGGFRFFSTTYPDRPTASDQVAQISGSTGQYSTLSDRRVKTNIAPLRQGLRTVLALRPVSYDFHTSRRLDNGVVTFLPDDRPVRALGFVAQDLYQVVPEAVEKPADERQGFYTVSYTTLVPVLTQAIQELAAENAALRARAATTEASLAADHASLLTLQAQVARLLGEGAQAGK